MAFANTQGGTVLIGVTDNRSVCGTTIGKEPLRHHIHIGRFKTPSMIIDDRQITDTLFEAIEQAMKVILFLISTWLSPLMATYSAKSALLIPCRLCVKMEKLFSRVHRKQAATKSQIVVIL